jgi:hypothetical protein
MKKLGYNKPNASGGNIFVKTSKIIGTMNTLRYYGN